MLADLEVLPNSGKLKEAELEKAILTADGLDAFARILNSDLQQIVVSPEGNADLLHQSEQASGDAEDIRGGHISGASIPLGNGLSMELDLPTNEIEATVAGIWSNVFGHEKIGIHQQFSALGGHSLIAMQIVARVRSYYKMDLSLREFFAAPTIAQLSSEIEAQIMREIESLSDDEAGQLVQTIKADEIP
jgi:acyl carrier protein